MDFAKFNKYTHQQEQECHASSTDNVGVYKNVLFLHTSKVYIGERERERRAQTPMEI